MFNLTASQIAFISRPARDQWMINTQSLSQDDAGNLFTEFVNFESGVKRHGYVAPDGGFQLLSDVEFAAVRNAITA